MDIWHTHHGIRFVWSAEKATRNIKKHGVTFELASQVLLDPFIRVVDASDKGEERDKAIGYPEASSRLVCVVHIIREDDAIRIISAWPATAEERRLYEDY